MNIKALRALEGGGNVSRDKPRLGSTKECQGLSGERGKLGSFDGAGWAGRGGAPRLSRVRGDPAESGVKLTPLCMGNRMFSSQ